MTELCFPLHLKLQLRAATLLVAVALLVAACGEPQAAAPPTPVASLEALSENTLPVGAAHNAGLAATIAPTVTVSPTAVPRLAPDVRVGQIDVGGLTAGAAKAKLRFEFAPLLTSLTLQVGNVSTVLRPVDLGLKLPYEQMVAEAIAAGAGGRVPFQVSYDESRLTAALQQLAERVGRPPLFSVLTSTVAMSRSFALEPGLRLDVKAAAGLVGTALRTSGGSRTISLTLSTNRGGGRPDAALLQQQFEEVAAGWKGVVGVYVYDLDRKKVLAELNADTVFSGASVMKVPILLQTYVQLATFSPKQERWLQQMIVSSDNFAANQLLAASVGGSGTMASLKGAEQMTEMLQQLGLEHTYQYAPYQTKDWLLKQKVRIKSGPAQEGNPPFTSADLRLRTTPAEISRVFLLIVECSQGRGALLQSYSQQLTPARCQEMIDRLHLNGDDTRMVAGFPPGTYVAHKSGWIDDMQADVGIVRSPGGNFLVAIYLYQRQSFANAASATPAIGRLARLVYSYFNPVEVTR